MRSCTQKPFSVCLDGCSSDAPRPRLSAVLFPRSARMPCSTACWYLFFPLCPAGYDFAHYIYRSCNSTNQTIGTFSCCLTLIYDLNYFQTALSNLFQTGIRFHLSSARSRPVVCHAPLAPCSHHVCPHSFARTLRFSRNVIRGVSLKTSVFLWGRLM